MDSAPGIKVCLLPGLRRCAVGCEDPHRQSRDPATPAPPPPVARGPRPLPSPHDARRCTRPRPPGPRPAPGEKGPALSVEAATPPPPAPPSLHPIASEDGWDTAAVVRGFWPMGKCAGPDGRGVRALSRSGPCENGGSECKAKFFCKPSAKAGGRRRRPRPGRVQLPWSPPF